MTLVNIFYSFPNNSFQVQFFVHLIFNSTPFFTCPLSSPGTVIKRTMHNNFAGLFFGLPFTKLNPEFVQSVKSQFSPESKLLLVCQEGLRLVFGAGS